MERDLQRVHFKQNNCDSLKNISILKSNTLLIQKINQLEEEQFRVMAVNRRMVIEVQSKSSEVERMKVVIEELKHKSLLDAEEGEWKGKGSGESSCSTARLSEEDRMDIQHLLTRFNRIKSRSRRESHH